MCLNYIWTSQACWSPMGYVGLKLVFDCSPIRPVGLRWVFNNNNIFVNFFSMFQK